MNDAREWLFKLVKGLFETIFGTLITANEIITQKPENFKPVAFKMAESIAEAIIPIAIVIAVIFFLIELTKKTMMFEMMTLESLAKVLFKFVFCKVLIQASFGLCVTINNGIFDILAKVVDITNTKGGELQLQLAQTLEIVKKEIDAMGVFSMIAMLPFLAIFCIALFIVNWCITLIIYGRFIELYILFALCPLPLATITSETAHDVAKKFLQKFIAVCLQAVVMTVIIGIFSSSIFSVVATGSMIFIIGEFILMFLILVLMLFKSGSIAKEIVGLA